MSHELANAIDQARLESRRPSSVLAWENVPGVLSDRTNAFGHLLGELAGEKCPLQPAGTRWTYAGAVYGPQRIIAWRVLDAQYFGVVQRRRRVFLVASARDDLDPAAVLFESTGVHRDSAQGYAPWQILADSTTPSVDHSGCYAGGLNPAYGKVSISFGGGNTRGPLERAACLTALGHKCDFEVETFVAQSVTSSSGRRIADSVQTGYRSQCGPPAFPIFRRRQFPKEGGYLHVPPTAVGNMPR